MTPTLKNTLIPAPTLLAGYRASDGIFDESHTAKGEMRPHYAGIVRSLGVGPAAAIAH